MLKNLFKNKYFIFAFTFILEFIFYFFFEHLPIGGEYFIPDIGLAPIFGIMFGPVGALGQALASLTWQILEGTNPVFALIDFGIMFFVSILAYKLWYSTFKRKEITTPKFDSTYNLLKFITIITIVSIVYWVMINIALNASSKMYVIYPLYGNITRISYVLNMFNFSIIFGLVLISIFNIKKIPMQTPGKWFNLINIEYKYFLLIAAILIIHLIVVIIFNTHNTIIYNVFFAVTLITAILFYLNKFEVDIKIKTDNYSIIEEIILLFMILLFIMMFLIFNEFEFLSSLFTNNLDTAYLTTIALSYGCFFIILLCIIHIHYVEKTITNPLYELINYINRYTQYVQRDDDSSTLLITFKKYLKSNDDVSQLIDSFISLNSNIKSHLSNIEKTTAENERIETQFKIASKIQSGMIKTDFDEFSAGRPFEIYGFMNHSKEVSGTFYDYFDIDNDNIGFVIGSVSGKGVHATLFMVKTMYLIENHSKFDGRPMEVFKNVNNLSLIRNEESLSVTSWFGKLNLKSGKLSFVNAGHNLPLIMRNNDDFEYLNYSPDHVLGNRENIDYCQYETYLNPGDMIFLYTDGIIRESEGENHIKYALNSNKDENMEVMIKNIENTFSFNDDELSEDMTILIIKYTGCDDNE